MANVSTGISGKTYLVTQEQFEQMPIGTIYMVLADNPAWFNGKMAILVSNTTPAAVLVQIQGFAWEDAPETYPNGTLLVEVGMFITLVTKELIDPLAGVPDSDLIKSMLFRGLRI